MTFYQRNGVFKKQILSDEQITIVTRVHRSAVELYSLIYGIDSVEETIRFCFEKDKSFVEVYEMGRHIERIEYKEVGFEFYCRAYLN